MRWKKNRNSEDEDGVLLDDLPRKSKREGWVYNRTFSDLDVIHDWGRLPSEFGLCAPEDDLNMMTAYTTIISKMRSYEEYIAEKSRKRK